jgi:signal transduction histidine kinase
MAHGGQVHMTSQPGDGTTVRIELPRTRLMPQIAS